MMHSVPFKPQLQIPQISHVKLQSQIVTCNSKSTRTMLDGKHLVMKERVEMSPLHADQ